MIYCIDSNIIIWGIKKQSSEGQEEMIGRAESFFRKVDEFNDFVIVPSIVIAEILAPEPIEIRAKYLEVINKSFIVAPFDTRAALKYAEIMNGRFETVKKIADEENIPRQKMKADHMIIAIAIVNNANCIYSTDNGLKSFAKGYINIQDLPPVKEVKNNNMLLRQQELFDKSDDHPF
jgi:predicted nucleic acid-binding protein